MTASVTRAAIGETARFLYKLVGQQYFERVSITNVYNKTVVVNNVTNVSYNESSAGGIDRPADAAANCRRQ